MWTLFEDRRRSFSDRRKPAVKRRREASPEAGSDRVGRLGKDSSGIPASSRNKREGYRSLRGFLHQRLILSVLAGIILCCVFSPARANDAPKVLVLHSYHQGYLWTDMIMEGISRTILASVPKAEIYVEYMNTKRHPAERIFPLLRDLYAVAYRDVRFNVIIASDNNALDFLLKYRDSLFPHVPVVFCGINNIGSYAFDGLNGYTGVSEDLDIASTIAIALRLHPGTKKIGVVTDVTETGRINLDLARAAIAKFHGIEFVALSGLSAGALKKALTGLPADSIVLNLSFLRDSEGRVFSSQESMEFVVRSTKRPVYTVWDFYMGPGVVGGKLLSGRLQGEAAARIAVRILKGDKPSAIPIVDSPTAYIFDYSGLKRFGLSESELPAGSIVLNRPDTLYERYKRYLWALVTLLFLQSVIIALLIRSIATRRREEAARRQAEGKYRAIFDNSIAGIFQTTPEGRFLSASPSLARMFGYASSEELIGDVSDVSTRYVHPEDRTELLRRLSEDGVVIGFETQFRRKDGSLIWVSISARSVPDEQTPSLYFEGFVSDITSQKKAEQERARLEEQLFQAQKMEAVGRLTGGIAHDFNNILTAIVGYGHLLQARLPRNDVLKGYAQAILASAERAAGLTQSLLTFSRKQPLAAQPVSLTNVVVGVEALLKRIIGEDVELKTLLCSNDLTVMANGGQIEQILMNLATNARDAMPKGGTLTIETKQVVLEKGIIENRLLIKPGAYAVISMTDTGTGMDEATREKIFEPFFTTKDVGKGTGLGLCIVYAIVAQHEGYINVYSERIGGTTFKIYFPLVEIAPEAEKGYELVPAPAGTETILLAEDDESVRILINDILEEAGYRVLATGDGEEAVQVFRGQPDAVDLLVLDVIMPRKTGKEVYEEISAARPDIRVLFMSGYTADVMSDKGFLEDGRAFVTKPVQPNALLHKIRKVLDEG